ncbi:hypothetical protein JTB14_003153 [Gonioctena quinquepunctata]|nr:hypothetical protein JTB14_003153 [Gonioctena quinquepunctata]
MILQPCNVELTKIHYYDKSRKEMNLKISTISQEVFENSYNKNVIIKRNVIGHRWVLRINEQNEDFEKKSKLRIVLYVLVFCSIVVAVVFGIFLSVDTLLFNRELEKSSKLHELSDSMENTRDSNETLEHLLLKMNDTDLIANETRLEQISLQFCRECILGLDICLKIGQTEKPRCVQAQDRTDPTGCGGLCPIKTHYCQILDAKLRVFQCSLLTGTLECPQGTFNCGNMCILEKKRCDGVMDCSNRTDEENCDCDLNKNFHCGNYTSCLAITKKCDKKIDCWDKSDELNCNTGEKCAQDEYPCNNNKCLPQENFCDGTVDCLDESDEPEGC